LSLAEGMDDVSFAQQALLSGVQINPGRYWFATEARATLFD
jgi:DNA-binding transcriptional MocR family regulator